MISKELYCISYEKYGNVIKEKAPISRRGFLGAPWAPQNRNTGYDSILTLHGKLRNAFMEFYV